MLGRIAAAAIIVGGLMFAPAEAEAGPHISVSVPAVRVDFPRVSVEVRGHPPGPDYVWVEGYTTYDRYGRPVYVQGHWERVAPVVVYERAPRVVHVHQAPRTKYHRPARGHHKHKHHHRHKHRR